LSEPVLRLEARDVVRVDGSWRVRWRVTNVGPEHVRLVAIRAPHSRFRSEPADLNVLVVENAAVEQSVRLEAAPGEDVENAFVIFVVVKEKETWRVLFRVRVHVGLDGTPSPVVEAMSSHRVGFVEA
jgi:hypothetical protein